MTHVLHGGQANDGVPYRPGLREMLVLEMPFEVKVSLGGNRVAINVRTTNWKDNCYENVCYVHDLATGATHRVNRTGSVTQVEWVDDQTLALLKQGPGDGDRPQVWLFEGLVGEGWAVTDHKTGVEWFKPFAGGLLFRGSDPGRKENKQRADRYGEFTHFSRRTAPRRSTTPGWPSCASTRPRQEQRRRTRPGTWCGRWWS